MLIENDYETVIATMSEKIRLLEYQLKEAKKEKDLYQAATNFKAFRLRGLILLYIGKKDLNAFSKEVESLVGERSAEPILDSLFMLENIPVSQDVKDALRTMTACGLNRF